LKDSYATDADGQIIDLAVWDATCGLNLSPMVAPVMVTPPIMVASVVVTISLPTPVMPIVVTTAAVVATVVVAIVPVIAAIMPMRCGYVSDSATSHGTANGGCRIAVGENVASNAANDSTSDGVLVPLRQRSGISDYGHASKQSHCHRHTTEAECGVKHVRFS
jgi:hypothetical protein